MITDNTEQEFQTRVQPFEAQRLPELDTADRHVADAARALAIACNGSVYAGGNLNSIMYALRWLRITLTLLPCCCAPRASLSVTRLLAEEKNRD